MSSEITTVSASIADTHIDPSINDTNNDANSDEVGTEKITPIAVAKTEEELSGKDDSAPSPLVIAAKPPNSAMDTAKSLNESNNKIIKELDDETAKTFPQILMEILTNDENSDTIAWLPHGRSFIIYKKKKFAAQVLVKYFKATKFTSFTRKLNRWGFTRVTRGTEMGSYFHKMFLRDNPELCLRMSSHTSSKYHHSHHHDPANPIQNAPHMHGHLVMNPGGVSGFMPPGALGMPVVPFPFYGMPGMAPGATTAGMVSPPNGIPPPAPMQANMPAPPTTAAEFSQQNQYINQQLQQLQWQQFQLQQYQHQQMQAAAAAAANHPNNDGAPYQQSPPGTLPLYGGNPYPPQPLQPQAISDLPDNTPPIALTAPEPPVVGQHPPSTGQAENGQHPSPARPVQQLQQQPQQQDQATSLMHPSTHGGAHASQQHPHYQNQQLHPSPTQQPPNNNPYGHNPHYQYGQQQSHVPHGPPHSHQGVSNGPNPPPVGHLGGEHYGGQQPSQVQLQPYPYQYPQQQPYHHHNPQQQQQQQQQQQHYNHPIHPQHSAGLGQQQQPEMTRLPPSSQPTSGQTAPSTPDGPDELGVVKLEQGEVTNNSAGANDITDKQDEDITM